MDVTDYIKVNKPELKMPRCESGTDELGIRYQGPVLSGMRGVKQQLELQAVSSPSASSQIRQIAPGGLNYLPPSPPTSPASDTRLDPDPMYAAQRRLLNNRADLCDPVLRHHLRLPPLPDPYEQRRLAAEAWQKERHKHVLP